MPGDGPFTEQLLTEARSFTGTKFLKKTKCFFVCLCVVVCVYLSLRYLTLIISTYEILRMASQFFISVCWLFWADMYTFRFLFYVFCKFNSSLYTK